MCVSSPIHLFRTEKELEWRGCQKVKKFKDLLTRFDAVHGCDRRADGQTPHDSTSCAVHSVALPKPCRDSYKTVCL